MKPHEEWLFKAYNDIESAKLLVSGTKKITDTAIYHTHQCAEKSLKAFIAFKNMDIEKTHNLKTLLNLCIEEEASFKNLIIDANFLNPFSSLFRYPGFDVLPDLSIVDDAIISAEKIYTFVVNLLNS